MTATSVDVLEYLAAELLDDAQADRVLRLVRADERERALAALLTVRPALPMPDGILAALEHELAAKQRARGQVEAEALPNLAEQGWQLRDFPASRVALWQGDLTRLRADAIVNAANSELLGCFVPGHACIDNAIHAAAGPRLRAACAEIMRERARPERPGTATVTGAYLLPSSHVVHTVGPIVRGPLTEHDRTVLAECYRSVLDAAAAAGCGTIGLCSISTGLFGFPKEEAAEVCLTAIARWFATNPDSTLAVIVSLFAEVDAAAYQTALQRRRVR